MIITTAAEICFKRRREQAKKSTFFPLSLSFPNFRLISSPYSEYLCDGCLRRFSSPEKKTRHDPDPITLGVKRNDVCQHFERRQEEKSIEGGMTDYLPQIFENF
jgi:hypothetical protein